MLVLVMHRECNLGMLLRMKYAGGMARERMQEQVGGLGRAETCRQGSLQAMNLAILAKFRFYLKKLVCICAMFHEF